MQHHSNEYVELRIRNVAWVCYCCFVCGCINGITTKGIFGLPSTALTAHNVRFAIAAAESRLDHLLLHFLILLGFGIGAFLSGLILARKSSKDCHHAPIRMDHPNASEWRWQHQLLVSLCLACMCSAHFLVLRDCSGLACHLKCKEARSISTTASIMLASCSSAMVNCMVMYGPSQHIILRAASPTGQISDLFALLGSCLKSRNARFLWKIKLQIAVASSFFLGAIAGANTFESVLSISSLLMPTFMLCPFWLLGIWFLLKHHVLQRRSARARSTNVQLEDSASPTSSEAAPTPALIAHVLNNAPDARIATLPRLSIIEDFPEYESEGLGQMIAPLPRLNVLGDAKYTMDSSEGHNTSGESTFIQRASAAGEHERLHYAHFFWIIYVAFVAGAINTIMVYGVFAMIGTPTGDAVTLMAFGLQFSPAPQARGRDSFSSLSIFLIVVLAFGLATCFCGYILTVRSSSGNLVMLKMDYPAVGAWRLQHHAIVSLCMISLCLSHLIVRDYLGGNPRWIRDNDVRSAGNFGFIAACMLVAFASGLLNTLGFLGRMMTVRATHSTASVNDVFLGMGFAIRSRSLRYFWRVRLLVFSLSAHFVGGVAGSMVFGSAFGASALLFPAILLAPAWVVGAILLLKNRWYKKKETLADSRESLLLSS